MRKLLLACIACLFIISVSGQNTGIGETVPTARLEVKGNGHNNSTSNLYLKNSLNQLLFRVKDSGAVGIGREPSAGGVYLGGPSPNLFFYTGTNIFGGSIIPTDSTLRISAKNSSGICFPVPCIPPPAGDLILQPPSSFFSFPGRVGILTNTPTTDFQVAGRVMVGTGDPGVGYQLSINGKMICTEARVQPSAAWPDYVFKKDYKLRTISQLEQFIKKNNHLPGIPSAKIMEEGQDLGETQRKIVEKVEELSLYIIQLHKRNEQLAAELKQIKQQLAKKK